MARLSEIIKQIEDSGGIRECYLHGNYYTGEWELNIEFNNEIANDILKQSGLDEISSSAFWEG